MNKQRSAGDSHHIEMIPLSKLEGMLARNNPKGHDFKSIKQSIKRHGWVELPALNERTGRVVAGNGRIESLVELKKDGSEPPKRIKVKGNDWLVPVMRGISFANQNEANAYLVASNELVTRGGWDQAALAPLLNQINLNTSFALEGTGFSAKQLQNLLAHVQTDSAKDVPVPDSPKSVAKAGDRWLLGDHIVLCGDSRELVGQYGVEAHTIWTDVPYGVNHVGGTKDPTRRTHRSGKKVTNDEMPHEQLQAMLTATLKGVALIQGGGVHMSVASGENLRMMLRVFEGSGFELKQTLVMLKHAFVFGRTDYHYRHELILYGHKPGAAHRWFGGRKQDTVFEVARGKSGQVHPTAKSVKMIAKQIENVTQKGEVVADPFLGAGSTLLAAEQTGRKCVASEIWPSYVDATIESWQELTGGKAKRQRNR